MKLSEAVDNRANKRLTKKILKEKLGNEMFKRGFEKI